MKKRSSYPIIVSSLKQILRNKKVQYKELSQALSISESSIKRVMNAEDASISKIEEICDYIGITFFDLIDTCKNEAPIAFKLSACQEKFLTKNSNYFYLFHLLYEEKVSVAKIRDRFKISIKSMNKYLKKLEDLNLLEWHPGNKLIFLAQGSIELERGSQLAKNVLKASMKNLTEIVTGDKKTNDIDSIFQFMEVHITQESLKRFTDSFERISQQLDIDCSREEKIYDIEELDFYTINFGVLPNRLYRENIPNI